MRDSKLSSVIRCALLEFFNGICVIGYTGMLKIECLNNACKLTDVIQTLAKMSPKKCNFITVEVISEEFYVRNIAGNKPDAR